MSEQDTTQPASGIELLEAGEKALERGESQEGYELLRRASVVGVTPVHLHRLARAFASAARYQSKQAEVLQWIEGAIEGDHEPVLQAALHRARMAVCSYLDIHRVESLVDEALAAAEAVADEEAYASIMASASFAAYRRGDVRAASKYAERAREREFISLAARYENLRSQMFGAIMRNEQERALGLLIQAREMARELDKPADVANESNNLAECYLDLGRPQAALACANEAIELAGEAGDLSRQTFARVLAAIATAESGRIDDALEQLEAIHSNDIILSIDTSRAHSYWLLERGAAGDAEAARTVATAAVERAEHWGVSNRLTPLYSNQARAYARLARNDEAAAALERARKAADRAEFGSQLLLALAVAEVLPVTNPKRKVVLNHARSRILRNAQRREDPRSYCMEVRLNHRLLELSGGVPNDLPPAT